MKELKIKARINEYGPWLNLTMQSFLWVIETRKELEKNDTDFVKKMVRHFELRVKNRLHKPFDKEPLEYAIINEDELKYIEQFAKSREVKLFVEEYKETPWNLRESGIMNRDGFN